MGIRKPRDRSKLGLKGHSVYGTALSKAAPAASLDIGLEDFAIMLDYNFPSIGTATTIIDKNDGATGYNIRCMGLNIVRFRLFSGGLVVDKTLAFGMRHRLWLFADRDANLYIYTDGILTSTDSIVAGNLNQDINQAYGVNYDNRTSTYRAGALFGLYQWHFGVGGLPDATTRQAIVDQDMANPYVVPQLLSSRVNAAAEERLRVDFSDLDPGATVVTDLSPAANHLTIGGGLTVSSVVAEESDVSPVLTARKGEEQYGMKYGWVDQQNLTGISIGTSDVVVEILLKEYGQDSALAKKIAATFYPYYFIIGDNATANYVVIFKNGTTGISFQVVNPAGIYSQVFDIDRIYGGVLHLWFVMRAASATVMMNGHSLRTTAKAAHNIVSTRIWLFGRFAGGGTFTPSIGSMNRIYIGGLSGFTDAQILSLHRKYIRTPYTTPVELLPYLKFKFTGRNPDGTQILDASTVVYNEVNSETLLIQDAKTWGQIKEKVRD
jgi:hypothetical protein